MDDRQFLPVPGSRGLFAPNPNFTGNKYELWKHYPVKVLKPLHGEDRYMRSKNVVVYRLPHNGLYLEAGGRVIFTDAVEGEHFELIGEENVDKKK